MTRKKSSDPLVIPEEFRAAVEYVADSAKEYFTSEQSMVGLGVAFETFQDMLLWKRFNCEFLHWGEGLIIKISNDDTAKLFELQTHDAAARRLFALIVSRKLLFAGKLSDDEARFAGFYLEGSLPTIAAKRGRKSDRDFERRRFIYILVHEVKQKFRLRLSRNDDTEQQFSACDAISAGFALAGRMGTSYAAVKQIASSKLLGKQVEEIRTARSVWMV